MSKAFRTRFPSLKDVAVNPDYVIQPKFDGVHGVCVLAPDGGKMLSRDNKEYLSVNHIIAQCRLRFGEGWVVFGEIYKFDTPFKQISGAARRHADQTDLQFVVYDLVPLDDFHKGRCPAPYRTRREWIKDAFKDIAAGSCPALIQCPTAPAFEVDPVFYADNLKAQGGYDGGMLKDDTASWAPGACKQGECIKIKPQVTLDLRVVGMEEGEGKQAGMMGALLVEYRGVISKVGSGFTDAERQAWWARRHTQWGSSLSTYIVEVKCLEVNEAGTLREPIFVAERHDKPKAD